MRWQEQWPRGTFISGALIFSLYEEEGAVFFDTGKSELSQLEILHAATRAYDELLKKRKLS